MTPEPPLLQAEETHLPQLLLTRQVFQAADHLGNPPLNAVQLMDVCLVLGGLNLLLSVL